MATINLGKIKPLWRGDYSAGATYRPLDFVNYNNETYINILESTGNLPTNETYFEKVLQPDNIVHAPNSGLANELDADIVPFDPTNTTLTATKVSTAIKQVLDVATHGAGYSFSWDEATSTPDSIYGRKHLVTPIHEGMKRCVLNLDGTVNYYLHPTNSELKEDGVTPSVLDGTDGMVMVEVPKFYWRYTRVGTVKTWSIVDYATAGYEVHPWFIKDGVEVDYRYISAYDACVRDVSAGANISGLNLDNATGLVNLGEDYLVSVAGQYPMAGLTRNEFRTLASNTGTGWRQHEFWAQTAIKVLFSIEYQTFFTQGVLGSGNTNGSYLGSSSNQNDSPHVIAGASNSWGNASTDGSQPSAGAKPGIAYMSYRGIENWYGNAWNMVDGVNVLDMEMYVSSTLPYADNTTTGYTKIGGKMPYSNGYVKGLQDANGAFVPSSIGGASTTYLTDYFYQSGNGYKVALVGGLAGSGALAGGWAWNVADSSASRKRNFASRLVF
jgi:hypothetical protein